MPENSGKKDALNHFLIRVAQGLGLIEEIWVDREIKQRGSKGEYSQGKSLSGRPVNTITELLKDDLSHCFKDKNFVFRIISVDPGGGKTTILNYLNELSKTNQIDKTGIQRRILPIFWSLNSLFTIPDYSRFGVEFYVSLIAELLSQAYREDVFLREVANDYLTEELDAQDFSSVIKPSQPTTIQKGKLRKILKQSGEDLLELFLGIVNYFSAKNVGLLFLLDELDSLYESESAKDAVNTFRNLINQVDALYDRRLPLGFYISGLSDDITAFIEQEKALKNRIYPGEISLVRFRVRECDEVRRKIDERLFDEYRGVTVQLGVLTSGSVGAAR